MWPPVLVECGDQYLRSFAEPAHTLTLGPHDGAGMCGRYVRWYMGTENGASDIKRYAQIVLLGCLCPTARPGSHTLATQPNPWGFRDGGGSGNLFRSRSRLGPLRLAADSPHLSAGGVTKPTTPTKLTALSLGCYYLLPCDNSLSDAVVGASGSGRRPAFHRSRLRGFGTCTAFSKLGPRVSKAPRPGEEPGLP